MQLGLPVRWISVEEVTSCVIGFAKVPLVHTKQFSGTGGINWYPHHCRSSVGSTGSPNVEWSALFILTFLLEGSGVLLYLPVREPLLCQACSSYLFIFFYWVVCIFLTDLYTFKNIIWVQILYWLYLLYIYSPFQQLAFSLSEWCFLRNRNS